MPIRRYLDADTAAHNAFGPETIEAMSQAFERACAALQIDGAIELRQIVAMRVIALASHGIVDPTALCDRVVAETRAMRGV